MKIKQSVQKPHPTAKLSAEPRTTVKITVARKRALQAEAGRQQRSCSSILADLIEGIGESRAPHGSSLSADLARSADVLAAGVRRLKLQAQRLQTLIKIQARIAEVAREIDVGRPHRTQTPMSDTTK